MQIMHSEGQRNGAWRDNSALRWSAQHACYMYMWAIESWSAMAEWVMFDAAVWCNGGLSHAIFFRFGHLMLFLAHGYSFQIVTRSRKAFPGRPTWGEKASFFLHFSGRSTSAGRISLRHRFAQSHNQFRSSRTKIRSSYPSLHGALRTTCQTDRQAIKAHGTYSRLRLFSAINA